MILTCINQKNILPNVGNAVAEPKLGNAAVAAEATGAADEATGVPYDGVVPKENPVKPPPVGFMTI